MPPLTAPKSGDALFVSVERVNAELFTLTYGAIVRQLLTDLEEVNKQLDQMGYNIGTRFVDDFLAKSNVSMCVDFKETADVIAKVLDRYHDVNTIISMYVSLDLGSFLEVHQGMADGISLIKGQTKQRHTILYIFRQTLLQTSFCYLGVLLLTTTKKDPHLSLSDPVYKLKKIALNGDR